MSSGLNGDENGLLGTHGRGVGRGALGEPVTRILATLRWPMLLALFVTLTRLPFLGRGYGADSDAWRAMNAARHLVDTGRYLPSRPPGYPLPEYFDAAMVYVGLGSSTWIGLLSALLSGVAAGLFFHLLSSLGQARAIAGALALSFTPVVFIASFSALDYMWGLNFFLAATMCALSRRPWLAAVFLGFAVASRPTYAVAIIPLALQFAEYELRSLRRPVVWRQFAILAMGSSIVALIFFAPVILESGVTGLQMSDPSPRWLLQLAYKGSLGVFGIVGFAGVAGAVIVALIYKRRTSPASSVHERQLDHWALTVLIVFGVLFIRLPDEASYLIPALLGLYWLLCRYAPEWMLYAMAAALVASCFVLRIGYDRDASPTFTMIGAVIHEVQIQDERRCVAPLVKRRLEASPDGLDYVIAGYSRAQLQHQLGPSLSERILYMVEPDEDGHLRDTESGLIPDGARLWLLDRTTAQPAQRTDRLALPKGRLAILDSYQVCPFRP